MKRLLHPDPLWRPQGIAIARIVLGALIIYHGLELFNSDLMKGYVTWKTFSNPYGKFMVYFGKTSELIAGIMLLLGLFTRVGAVLLMGTLAYITFFVGHGKFWYEDQHPFLFVLMGLVFFFHGPGAWSIDALIHQRKSS